MGHWRKCSTCGQGIALGAIYQRCSVSTCRKSVYCSVDCWDVHLPILNHKEAWAIEEVAPRREIVEGNNQAKSPEGEILVVASKLKAYVKARHGLNTSGQVLGHLSEMIRKLSDRAAEQAQREGRKTLMDRDFPSF